MRFFATDSGGKFLHDMEQRGGIHTTFRSGEVSHRFDSDKKD